MKTSKDILLQRKIRRQAIKLGQRPYASMEEILRAVRHAIETPEGANVIDRAVSVMRQLKALRSKK